MLKRLWSDRFLNQGEQRDPIEFHPGLNIVEGAAQAQNSIGKSTLLEIIDFIYGGSSFPDSDVVRRPEAVGHHTIYFTLLLRGQEYHFSRATDRPGYVTCYADDHWRNQTEEWTKDDYFNFLLDQYGLTDMQTSWRDLIGRFSRRNEEVLALADRPLAAASREADDKATNIALRLFGIYAEIATVLQRYKDVDKQVATLNAMAKGRYSAYIALRNKDERKEAERNLADAKVELRQLRVGQDLTLFDNERRVRAEQQTAKAELQPLTAMLSALQGRLANVDSVLAGATRITTNDLEEFYAFFPSAERERLETIEFYHHELSRILTTQLEEQRLQYRAQIANIEMRIKEQQARILALGKDVQLDEEDYDRSLQVHSTVERLEEQIRAYDANEQLKEERKKLLDSLDHSLPDRVGHIAAEVNSEMDAANRQLYPQGERKVCPKFSFKVTRKGVSYEFSHEGDTGSGAKSRHLALFDIAMLRLTPLPFLIHDSAMIKLVAFGPVRELIQVYSTSANLRSGAAEPKQVFFSFDATQAYGRRAEEFVDQFRVIHLGEDAEALYGFTWNTEGEGDEQK